MNLEIYKYIKINNRSKIYLSFAILFCFILMYILNRFYPLFGEDWDYAYFWVPNGDHPDRVRNIMDIIRSQYNHYLYWGGRNIAHGIDQLLLMIGDCWHDILNALALVFLSFGIYKISNKNNETNAFVFVIAFLALWFIQPTFIIDTLWLTYSVNYLWTTMIIVWFIYFYYSYYRTNHLKNSITRAILFFIFGIIAGWTNENMGPALIFLIIAFLILIRIDNKGRIPIWTLTGLLGVMLGYYILFTAPGNYIRIGESDASIWDIFSFSIFLQRLQSVAKGFFFSLLIPTIIYIILLLIYRRRKNTENNRKIFRASLLFYLSALVALLVLLFTPGFGRHVLFGITTLGIIPVVLIYANIGFKTNKKRFIHIFLFVLIFLIFLFDYCNKFNYFNNVDKFWKKRALFVEQQKAKGIKDIIFTDYIKPDYHTGMYDMYDCPECWINRMYARYYGLNTVRVRPNNLKNAEDTENTKE